MIPTGVPLLASSATVLAAASVSEGNQGFRLTTVTVKVWEAVLPAESVAMIVTPLSPTCVHVGVQEITPVVGSIVIPSGELFESSEYVTVSPASASVTQGPELKGMTRSINGSVVIRTPPSPGSVWMPA